MRKTLIACGFVMLAGWVPQASAADLCGGMLMPAAQLKQVSRGISKDHSGLDLTAPYGSPVRAALGGTVIFNGTYFGYGRMVDIRHANGMVTRYAHLSAVAVGIKPGAVVDAGSLLGAVGTSGHAHGAHLHFEVRIDGKATDPKPYLGLAVCQVAPRPAVEPIEEASAPEHPRRDLRPK